MSSIKTVSQVLPFVQAESSRLDEQCEPIFVYSRGNERDSQREDLLFQRTRARQQKYVNEAAEGCV